MSLKYNYRIKQQKKTYNIFVFTNPDIVIKCNKIYLNTSTLVI